MIGKAIRKQQYGENENVEKRLESAKYYLELAYLNKIRNPRVTKKRSKQIMADRVIPYEASAINYEGEMEYWRAKECYKLACEMAEFVGYDQKCIWNVKLAFEGDKMMQIENVRSFYGQKKILLDFSTPSVTKVLMILSQSTAKCIKNAKSMEALFEKHKEHWNSKTLQLVFLYVGDLCKDFPVMGNVYGKYYFIKTKYAMLNEFLAVKLKEMNSTPILTVITKEGVILACEQYNKQTAESSIYAALKGEAKQPTPPTKLLKTTFEDILELHGKVLKPTDMAKPWPIFTGKFEITEVYNPCTKQWEYFEGILNLMVRWLNKASDPEKILNSLNAAAKDHFILKLDFPKELKTFSISRGDACSACLYSLRDCDHFVCIKCNPVAHFCLKCGLNEDAEKSLHIHPLILVQKDSTEKELELLKGQKSITREGGYSKIHKGFQCEHCGVSPIVGTRWRCANCHSKNFCDNCFIKFSKNTEDLWGEVMKIGHNILTHVYVRIDFAKNLP